MTTDAVRAVAPDVYDLTLERSDARYRAFLVDDGRPTLVDCGFDRTTDALFDRLATLGVAPDRLVVTHVHPDHSGGFDAVVDRYDPETWVPAESTHDFANEPAYRYGHEDPVGPFEAVHVPGHTDDNYALVDEDRGVAVMGDAAIGADWRGLPAGYFVLVEGIYSNDLRAAERNLERLQAYDFDVGLVFHGGHVRENARETLDAFLDFPGKPDRWPDAD
ncbi:MBL fold metallo-hydrolase [Halobacterium yunchengense]|uniref:MBL fold metallo-hydrolase n=1 Tax=Halobacterium yunchengense TaxID=3108497 RepID=UPI003008253F